MLCNSLTWLSRVSLGLLVAASAIPLWRTGNWLVRICDFPRVQILLLLSIPLVASTYCLTFDSTRRREHAVLLTIVLLTAIWQSSHILPFTPLWTKEIANGSSADAIRLMVANVEVENRQCATVLQQIKSEDPDVLLLIEIDDHWHAALQELNASYPYRKEEVRGDGLGIALWSKPELKSAEIQFLVSERRPSIFAEIRMPDGQTAKFVGVHPTPPGLNDSTDGGRRNSRVRDAELMHIAREVQSNPSTPWIVAGDFNDVAWSHTTRLFKRTSGLCDPRIGRALLNTYHADFPLLRYPIDQLFLSEGSTIQSLRRVRLRGSDHFAIVAEFQVDATNSPSTVSPRDESEAEQLIREGEENAEQRNVQAGDADRY